MRKEIDVVNSYTLESSFAGLESNTQFKGYVNLTSFFQKMFCLSYHYKQKDFEQIGHSFCETLLNYIDKNYTNILSKAKIEIINKQTKYLLTNRKSLSEFNIEQKYSAKNQGNNHANQLYNYF